jgi:hypothetical protein
MRRQADLYETRLPYRRPTAKANFGQLMKSKQAARLGRPSQRQSRLNRPPAVGNLLVVQMPDARYVGRVAVTLRPGYRLFLGLERFEDAVTFLLDDIVLDSTTLLPAFVAGLDADFRHVFSPVSCC